MSMIKKYLSLFLCLLVILPLVGLSFTSCDAVNELTELVFDELDESLEETMSNAGSASYEEEKEPKTVLLPEDTAETESAIDESGTYDDKENVALYIHTYGKLPPNYITKKEAQELGWEGGSVEKYAPGKCIGGSVFGNYEGILPDAEGRTYYECDIGTLGESSRGAKRLVYSNDGLIYYTEDHYESFELLYGDE